MSQLRKIDHVAYACASGMIEKWAWFQIEVEGGTLIKRIDDARPGDPHSSMKIWCIDYGNFGIALIEGIDRAGKSQVTSFVEKHGDHSCQHVAYDCHDLDAFIRRMKSMGGHPRGGVLVQDAINEDDREPFFDLSRIPPDWKVPAERPKVAAGQS